MGNFGRYGPVECLLTPLCANWAKVKGCIASLRLPKVDLLAFRRAKSVCMVYLVYLVYLVPVGRVSKANPDQRPSGEKAF